MASILSEEEINEYYSTGYFIKRGVLSNLELEGVGAATEQLMKKAKTAISQSAKSQPRVGVNKIYLDGAQIVYKSLEGGDSILRIPSCVDIEPALNEHLISEKMLNTF